MDDDLLVELRQYCGDSVGPVYAWDRVNEPMIRQWCEALDFNFGPYLDSDREGGVVAPVTMMPVWLMPGLNRRHAPGSDERDHRAIMKVLEREGFHGILGTNCEQEYERRLRPGEKIASTYQVESVSDRKQTKFGPGYFITFLQSFWDEEQKLVGTMRLRIVRFKPAAKTEVDQRPDPPQPSMSQDTAFFWEGLQHKKLLIQRCSQCGLLRHPPGPACTACHSLDWDTLESSGTGSLYSFVIIHKPQNPAFDYPHPVGLIELDEGVRMIAPLAAEERERLVIGSRMHAVFSEPSEVHRLPVFHLSASA